MIFLLLLIQADTLQLSLDQALAKAFEQSPAQMSARVDRVQGGIDLARGVSVLLPTPQASISRTTTEQGPVSARLWTGTIGVSQILADVGLIPGIIQSVHLDEFYGFQARDKTNKLVLDVKSGYYNIIKAYGLVEAGEQALKQAQESVRLLEEQYRLGQVSRIDLLRAQVFASQAEINLGSAHQGFEAANEDLKATLGIREPVMIKPTEELSRPAELTTGNFDSLFALLKNHNPNLRASYEFERQAKAGVWSATSRILPTVSLFTQSSYSDSTFPTSRSQWQNHDIVSYGLGINFPLFDIKTILLNISDARNGAKSATVQRMTAELAVAKALKEAVVGFNEAEQRSTFARKNLELSEEVEKLGLEQLRLGALSLIDLLDVETKLTQARTQYISALCDTYIGKAELEYLIGGR